HAVYRSRTLACARYVCCSSSLSRRAPLSFPTRRSSDLPLDGVADPIEDGDDDAVLLADEGGPDTEGGLGGGAAAVVDGEQDVVGDRKSTRLNSSHVKISYAVFCLKKKNTAAAGEKQGLH